VAQGPSVFLTRFDATSVSKTIRIRVQARLEARSACSHARNSPNSSSSAKNSGSLSPRIGRTTSVNSELLLLPGSAAHRSRPGASQ
jgi:hypothetical protein